MDAALKSETDMALGARAKKKKSHIKENVMICYNYHTHTDTHTHTNQDLQMKTTQHLAAPTNISDIYL